MTMYALNNTGFPILVNEVNASGVTVSSLTLPPGVVTVLPLWAAQTPGIQWDWASGKIQVSESSTMSPLIFSIPNIELLGDAGTINGVAITGTPVSGQVPIATSGTTATWQTPTGEGGVSVPGAGLVKSTGSALAVAVAGTDYLAPGGALGTPTGGNLINCTFPTLNQNTTGSAGSLLTGGVLNTPASGNLVNCTFPTLNQNTTGSAASVATGGALNTPASGNLVNCTFPTLNQNTTGSAAKWTTPRTLAGNTVDGSANVGFANKFIAQGTADAGLSAAQFLGALGTGLVKNTTTTGVLSLATAGTDYAAGSAVYHVLNVRDFGAVGDGVTDDSAAFLAAFTAAASNSLTTFTSNARGTRTIYIPSGTYIITQPENFMAPDLGSAIDGIKWRGDGRESTAIVYNPSGSNTNMLHNDNNYLDLTFEDMTFYSESATATWMFSKSTGQAQNYIFNRVNWNGTWTYGLNLTGTNTNSEMTWFHCGIHGNWTAFLFVGSAVGAGGDQFLNYNFFATQVETLTGNFIDMSYGGSINVWGGSFIHEGSGTQTTSSPQCFFRLGASGDFPGNGTPRLLVQGIRVEHRHNASSLIQCDWPWGEVSFIGCSTDVWATLLTTPTAVIEAQFGIGNGSYPIISFDKCSLMGIHEYHFGGNSWNSRTSIEYKSCWITNATNAAAFISYINDDSNGNLSGQPPVKFTKCIGSDSISGEGPTEQFDCTVGWPSAQNLVVELKTISLQRPYGGLGMTSDPTTTVNLPLNAIITRIRAVKGTLGSAINTNWSYTLTDANSTTIATVALGTAWNAGWNYDSGAMFHRCSSTNARELTLTAANITQVATDNFFLIDYLA
jgi:Pectate lyase superfamily protein